jgi:hypothetical protein
MYLDNKPNRSDLKYYYTINTKSQFIFDYERYISDFEEYCDELYDELINRDTCCNDLYDFQSGYNSLKLENTKLKEMITKKNKIIKEFRELYEKSKLE